MRILHTADWHLGKIVNEFSMLDLQEEYLKHLIEEIKN
jgi:DNA repair exonuclease